MGDEGMGPSCVGCFRAEGMEKCEQTSHPGTKAQRWTKSSKEEFLTRGDGRYPKNGQRVVSRDGFFSTGKSEMSASGGRETHMTPILTSVWRPGRKNGGHKEKVVC